MHKTKARKTEVPFEVAVMSSKPSHQSSKTHNVEQNIEEYNENTDTELEDSASSNVSTSDSNTSEDEESSEEGEIEQEGEMSE